MNSYSRKSVIRAHKEPMFRGEIQLFHYIVENRDGVERVSIVGAGTVSEVKDEGALPAATLVLAPSDAQLFMDELWNVGIRPSEGTGSAGQLSATQAHLKDMQRLVFDWPPERVEIRKAE